MLTSAMMARSTGRVVMVTLDEITAWNTSPSCVTRSDWPSGVRITKGLTGFATSVESSSAQVVLMLHRMIKPHGVSVPGDNPVCVPLQDTEVPVATEVDFVGVTACQEAPWAAVFVLELDPVLAVDPRQARQVKQIERARRAPVVADDRNPHYANGLEAAEQRYVFL